jgi:hypothetical protein
MTFCLTLNIYREEIIYLFFFIKFINLFLYYCGKTQIIENIMNFKTPYKSNAFLNRHL